MTTPATRIDIGDLVVMTTVATITSTNYSSAGKRLLNNVPGEIALVADFTLTNVTFSAAPVAGAVMLVIVDRDADGNQGPVPSAGLVGKVYKFSPEPSTGNTATSWIMSCNRVPISKDCDFWLYNASTGQSISAGAVCTAQRYGAGM